MDIIYINQVKITFFILRDMKLSPQLHFKIATFQVLYDPFCFSNTGFSVSVENLIQLVVPFLSQPCCVQTRDSSSLIEALNIFPCTCSNHQTLTNCPILWRHPSCLSLKENFRCSTCFTREIENSIYPKEQFLRYF